MPATSRYAPPAPGLFKRVAWSAVVVGAVVLVVAFVAARPRAAEREADVVVADLGVDAVPCRRAYGRGTALHCEITRAVVAGLGADERRSRLEATRLAAHARGFAVVVLVDDERPWRVIDTATPVPPVPPRRTATPAPSGAQRRH